MTHPSPLSTFGKRLHSCSSVRIAALLGTAFILTSTFSSADELDLLLNPTRDSRLLSDEEAKKAWNDVVDAFRRNDMAQAVDFGKKFLDGNYRSTPYQVLGAKVMINLATEADGVTTSNKNSIGKLDGVMAERAQITAKYNALLEAIRTADTTINRLTSNRTRAVQQGTAAHRECVRCAQIIEQANAELELLKPQIEKNKEETLETRTRLSSETKSDILRLLDMLIEANELEAAFAITNVYLRKTGEDLDIAKKQQDVIRLREIHDKAIKIAKIIVDQQRPLVEGKNFWAAKNSAEKALAKVRQQASDVDLVRMVEQMVGRDELRVEASISKADEETEAIISLAEIDPAKARSLLEGLGSRYPDHPRLDVLRLRISAQQSQDMKGKMAELLSSIETLADSDPEGAVAMLASLDPEKIDPVERMSMQARISTAANKSVSALLAKAERTLEEVKTKIGGEVAEVVAAQVEQLRNDKGDTLELSAASVIRAKIDRSEEIPEARATVEGLSKSLAMVSKLKITTQQEILLKALTSEVRMLRAALR